MAHSWGQHWLQRRFQLEKTILFLDAPLDPAQFSEGVVAHGGIYVLFMEIRQSITVSYMENERKFAVYSILKISQQNQMTNVQNAERISEHHQDNYSKNT